MKAGLPDDIYREHILELYKSPSNFGELEKPTHKYTEYNSNCGDEVTVHLIEKNGKIEDAKFSGSGCVISMVSSSMVTDKIKGMSVGEVKKMSKKDILDLLKINLSAARIKCALLPLEAIRRALK